MNHLALVVPGIERLGGAEMQVCYLAKGLLERRWRVTVIAMSGSGGDAGRALSAAGVGLVCLGMKNGLADPQGWIRFHRWIRRNHPDVLHAHLPHAAWLARWSRLLTPVRVVCDTVHTSSCGTLGRRLGYRCSNWLTDAVSAVSQGAADAYLFSQMVTADRLRIIPNGVDTGHWEPPIASDRSAVRDLRFRGKFLWLAVGRLEPVKNHQALLEAFARLPAFAHLVIAGSGSMEDALRRQCADLALESRVDFVGYQQDVVRWMQTADALALPSLWEGLPMVLLEAGACQLPAVATDVPGSREVLIHGETGLLAKAGSRDALAASMSAMMLMDAAKRRQIGRNACQRVKIKFSLGAALDRWDMFYRELLDRRSSPSRSGIVTRTPAID